MINGEAKYHLLFQLVGLDKCFVTTRMITLVVTSVFMYGLDVVAEGVDASQHHATFITCVLR